MSGTFYVKRGETVSLVKWKGLDHELVIGTYRGCTKHVWRLEVQDIEAEYDRAEWEVCLP
jgi:hypothetical protein